MSNKHVLSTKRPHIQSALDMVGLFPSTPAIIKTFVYKAIAQATEGLESLYAVPRESRNFDNTMYALDLIEEHFVIINAAMYALSEVSPDEGVRKAAHEALKELNHFSVDHFTSNMRLYEACSDYQKLLENPAFAAQENLTSEQKRFVEETMRDFRRIGLQLAADKRERIKELQKELNTQCIKFSQTIAAAQRTFEASKEELRGLSDAFIATLKKTEQGSFILTTERPSYDEVLHHCLVPSTRERMYKEYVQRAYPENKTTLTTIIKLRDELAQTLGYPSYAHYEIEIAMAKSPEMVKTFLSSLIDKARLKCAAEMKEFTRELPEGVALTEESKLQPWDLLFVQDHYKKNHLKLDETEVSHYFPLDHTIPAILKVYEMFFGLRFEKKEAPGLWHNDVELLAVYKDGVYRGAVLLDLYPRPFKFSHAAVIQVVPALTLPGGEIYPGVIVLMANFKRPHEDHPALFKRHEALVFFHEFGHVIHSLLGATDLARFSGLKVKRDFVEMPSQMLEEWMYDTEVLKMISCHYLSKEPLTDALIQKIQQQKNYAAGDFVLGQLVYGFSSLTYFLPGGTDKDVASVWKEMNETFRSHVAFNHENQGYCSFGHLIGYGARYYGYLWSQVFALDLFTHIEHQGLLDRAVGECYSTEVISKGGSEEPADLIKNFLGREPNSEAFFKDLGL